MPNTKQSYEEECLERFEEQFKDSFTYGAMETWEDGLAVKDFISQALEDQMKEVMNCFPGTVVLDKEFYENNNSKEFQNWIGFRDYEEKLKENLKQAGLI